MMSSTQFLFSTITGLLVFILSVRALETLGTPGVDYPNYHSIPKTSFSCTEQKYFPGFYADVEAGCQVFHLCLEDGQESFLCPTGTIYNQGKLTCDPWYNSNCSLASQFYSVNSGPVMESARKNIPMLIKLRNRSQNRQATLQPTADVYEKITSLYGRTSDEEQSGTATSNVAEYTEVESNPELKSDRMLGDESQLNEDLLSSLDENIQSDEESQDHVYYTDALGQEAEENEPGILYDPVTEQYYVDYESTPNDWQRDPDHDINNHRSFYDYDSIANKYGFALNDFDESKSDIESEVATESTINLDELKDLLETVETNEREQLRMLDTEKPSIRVRRRPLYAVVREDEAEIPEESRGVQYPILDSDFSQFTIKPVIDTDAGSELQEEMVYDRVETDPDVSLETADQYHDLTPLNTSEEPLTSEEFEEAMLRELVLPKTDEFDLRLVPFSEQHEESSVSQDFQENQSSFVEDVIPDNYESYSAENHGDDTVTAGPESDQEIPVNEGVDWYQSGATTVEESSEVDDTYVVIPDESDGNVFEQQSEDEQVMPLDESPYDSEESDDQIQSDEAYDSYEALKSYFLSKYASPVAYASQEPYGFQAPELYFSNEFVGLQPIARQGVFNTGDSELPQSPLGYAADSGSNIQGFQVGFPYGNLPEGYSFADYTYGTENGYYGEFYESPYFYDTGSLDYDSSKLEDSAEYSTLNIPDADFKVDRDDSGPEISSWIQRHLTESSEMVEQFGVTDSSNPTEGILTDLYDATESSREDLSEKLDPQESSEDIPTEDNESMQQGETYYIFDFEDNDEKEIKLSDNVETSESGTVKLSLEELFQTEEPWQPNETLGDLGSIDVSQSEPTETEEIQASDEDLDSNVNMKFPYVPVVNTKSSDLADSGSFQTESSRVNDKPVTLSSALEQLAGLKTGKSSTESDIGSLHTSRNIFNSMAFPENVDLGSYTVADMDKHYSMPEASMTPSTENVYSHRSGNVGQTQISKMSAIQERIRSLKHGKFGAFKKYMNSAGNKDQL